MLKNKNKKMEEKKMSKLKINFWNYMPKTFRFEYWNKPCPCGCDLRDTPNLKSYHIISLYFFGFSILYLNQEAI